jgi:hypothetical protein
MPATPMNFPQWSFCSLAIRSFGVVRAAISRPPIYMAGVCPDVETAVVMPASPISSKNASIVPLPNDLIESSRPRALARPEKYDPASGIVTRQRTSMIGNVRLSAILSSFAREFDCVHSARKPLAFTMRA